MGSWFLLIPFSVLTTWQHHVIDVIGGFIAAVLISYAISDEGVWYWRRPGHHATCLAMRYLAGSILFSATGILLPGAFILIWPGMALCLIALGYTGFGGTIFQKNTHGHLSLPARILLLPYLLGARMSMHGFMRNIPKNADLGNGIFLGSFPVDLFSNRRCLI